MNQPESDFLSALNSPQREAVTHPEGPMLVLAGAGSGKTRVITYRIAHLIRELEVKPWRILAVTFTNKAAGEMRHRVESILGGAARGIWMGTFHSICLRILRREIERIGYPADFIIYDRSDQLALVRRCLREEGIEDKKIRPEAVLGQISNAKQKLMTPENYAENARGAFEDTVALLYKRYQESLHQSGALDFDDLLMMAVQVLRDFEDVREEYQARFDHVLVDEYQDTNRAQYLIVHTLAKRHGNLCVVGDDDQSIYSWRGANVENILGFEKDWPKPLVVRLEQNYRSTGHILAAAGGLIKRNKGRKAKELWTAAELGEKVQVLGSPDDRSEATWVAERCKELHEEKKQPYSQMAVFYRVNAQSRAFEEAFNRMKIPHVVVGATAFYERKEVKDILAYLRLVCNPGDRVAFARVVNTPRRQIGTMSLEAVFNFSTQEERSVCESAMRAAECPFIKGAAVKSLTEFGAMIRSWRRDSRSIEMPLEDFLKQVLEDSGYKKWLEADRDPQSETRLENLKELVSAAVEAGERMQEESEERLDIFSMVKAYLDEIALITDVDKLRDEDRVALLTLHSAKGLEFPVVFLTGFEQGLIPHNNSIRSGTAAVEEERRLCYVGMTRAQSMLHITHAHTRMVFGRTEIAKSSDFLHEIPNEHLNMLPFAQGYDDGVSSDFTRSSSRRDRMATQTYAGNPRGGTSGGSGGRKSGAGFKPGDNVHHRTFGLGVVLSVQGRAENAKIQVDFQHVGKKTLVQLYAKLKRV